MNPEISDAIIASGFDNMMEKIVADLSTKRRAAKSAEITPDMFVDAVCQAYIAGFRSACEIWRASQ